MYFNYNLKRKEKIIMKLLKKITLLFFTAFLGIILSSHFSYAATASVYDETTLTEAINNATEATVIELQNDISLTKPIEITDKTITINGNGHTITKNATTWNDNGPNGSLLTAGAGTKLILNNLSLTNSHKYGVQSYNGGYVTLNQVKIMNNGFGGVLANGGTVEVIDLYLGHNGTEDSNNGIEISQGQAVAEENKSTVKMNGKLSSNQETNVIYIDMPEDSHGFHIVNEENSENKIFVSGNKLVVTDQENNILYVSNETEDIDKNIEAESYIENLTVTIQVKEKPVTMSVMYGRVITKEQVESKIDLASLGFENYTIDGFYSDEQYTEEFNFGKGIITDTTIYVKLTEKPTTPSIDTTPKTGIVDATPIAMFIFAISVITLITLKRKVK